MTENIWLALIGLAGTLVGVFGGGQYNKRRSQKQGQEIDRIINHEVWARMPTGNSYRLQYGKIPPDIATVLKNDVKRQILADFKAKGINPIDDNRLDEAIEGKLKRLKKAEKK